MVSVKSRRSAAIKNSQPNSASYRSLRKTLATAFDLERSDRRSLESTAEAVVRAAMSL
jgi:hypothetical protein